MTALLMGSLSTLCDTSELQREAFNEAFRKHDLNWHWTREQYVALLQGSGGVRRIAEQAAANGQQVDAEGVHATKSDLFQTRLLTGGLEPRPGVVETVRQAREAGHQVALVTTTSSQNVAALLVGLSPHLTPGDFDLVVDATCVTSGKPDPAAYAYALEQLHVAATSCIAVEDNVPGLQAAAGAGIACLAFPNANTADHDFTGAAGRVSRLDLPTVLAALDR